MLFRSPKTIRRTHSQDGGPVPWSASPRRRDHGELTLCPADAEALGLSDRERAVVFNDRGSTIATVVASDDIAPGVACLHQGVWLDLGPDGTDRAGSANALSSTEGTGPAFAPVMHGLAVGIRKA